MFIRTVTITVPADREDEMYAFWEWASAIVCRQPGYIQGRLWRDLSDPKRFTEVHEWEREEDSNAYRATEQFREVIGRLVALSQIPPQVSGYSVVRASAPEL
jgi:heme-degrading monooxygenase HmoA